MKKFARSQITIELEKELKVLPQDIKKYNHKVEGKNIIFFEDKIKVNEILKIIEKNNLKISDVNIDSSSLEDIFIEMVRKNG